MKLHRLSKTNFIHDLTGEGARLFGGRWNKKGTPILYVASNMALAVLENLVHISDEPGDGEYSLLTVDINAPSILTPNSLGVSRKKIQLLYSTNSIFTTQAIGTEWAKQRKSLLFRVPSTVIFDEENFLVNPLHPEFHKVVEVRTEVFNFDERLFFPK